MPYEFHLDVRTLLWVLWAFNFSLVIALIAFPCRCCAYKAYFWAKLLQACAWFLLATRGHIPDVLSAALGNSLLVIGFSLEIMIFARREYSRKYLLVMLSVVSFVGCALFWSFHESPAALVIIASVVSMAIFGVAGIAAFFSRRHSPVQTWLVIGYGLLSLVLFLRAYAAFQTGGFDLFSPGWIQKLTFAGMAILLLGQGVILLLHLKEEDAEKLQQENMEIALQEILLRKIFNASNVSIFVTNREWEITLANKRMADMFGYPVDGLIGMPHRLLLGSAETADASLSMNRLLRGEIPELRMECQYRREDGSLFWGMLAGSAIFDPSTQNEVFLGVVSDISELKAAGARIQDMAYHDMLTGLSNRVLFSDRLRQQITLAHRQQKMFYLLFIDLDGFKQVNDQFGHARGDLVLQEVAERLRGCARESDTIARFGGDEFVMILPLTVGLAGAQYVGDKILAALSRPYQALPDALRLSASIGVARYPHDGASEAELMLAADAAMYAAKNEGKNRLSFHAPTLPAQRAASFSAC